MKKLEINWDNIPHPRTFNLQELQLWALNNVSEHPDSTWETIASELGVSIRTVSRMLKKYRLKTNRKNNRIESVIAYLQKMGYNVTLNNQQEMTREEQIKQYCDEQGFPFGSCSSIDSVKAIVATAAIKWADEHPKSPWISVEERLPISEELCFVIYKSTGIVNVAYYMENYKAWVNDYTGEELHGITHWFYMPKLEEE